MNKNENTNNTKNSKISTNDSKNIDIDNIPVNLNTIQGSEFEMIPHFKLDLPAINIKNDPREPSYFLNQNSIVYVKDYKVKELTMIYYHLMPSIKIPCPKSELLSPFEIIYVPKTISPNEIHVFTKGFLQNSVDFIFDIQDFNLFVLNYLINDQEITSDIFAYCMSKSYNDVEVIKYDEQRTMLINKKGLIPAIIINPYVKDNGEFVSCMTILCNNANDAKNKILNGEYILVVNTVLTYHLDRMKKFCVIERNNQNEEFGMVKN
jgi:hypothetical protein